MTTVKSDIEGLARRLAAQFGIFGLVGVANTLVDLACTNLLFLAFRPVTPVGLSLVAIVAGAVATVHSYVLNSRWTFRGAHRGAGARSRFLGFALVGLATQAAVTLFVSRWLLLTGSFAPVMVLNAAKIAAVVCAAGVTFLGYRLSAFAPASLAAFRDSFALIGQGQRVSSGALAALLALAAAVRAAFVTAAPVAYGDAINYSWVAWLVGHGRAVEADAFWHSAYDYWQALLVPLGLDQFHTMVAASLVPGVLMVIPAYLIALRLYGRTAALVAGLAVALHPRLVEYSVNGYAEAFFLHAALWAAWAMTVLVRQPRHRVAALVAGVGLGTWFVVRNESVVAAGLIGLAVVLAWRRTGRGLSLAPVAMVALCAAAVVACYVAADVRVFGAPQLFSKASNLTREHTEMLDPREAAREAYRIDKPAARNVPPAEIAVRLLERWPRNVAYTLERLPGVLLSPLFLFALLLPALCRRRGSVPGEEWPLLAFTLWPLLFYPFLQLEPRMLLAVAIGTCIFGAAGLVAFGAFLAQRLQAPTLRQAPAALAIVALLPLIPLLARHTEAERGFHRDVGRWLATNVDATTSISGDGYGYVTASGFWAARRVLPRVWTDDAAELGRVTAAASPRVVVLYEKYLRESNPELLGTLDHGIPGLVLQKSFSFGPAGRVQVWSSAESAERVASTSRLR